MKITTIETIHLRHPLARRTGPASVLNDARECLLVKIGTDEGLVGWGEAVAFPGVREQIIDGFGLRLVGRDPLDVQRTWRNAWMAPFESGLALRFIADLLTEPLSFRDGLFDLPTKPGLGIDINEEFVRQYRV
ncbi:MAG TPA: hypothetical protein VNF73_15020 [Candidatus Saccharimonadales bacterium]|nr:hypothetical protein [Candidatus Saccharimonadales bacterium]